MKGDPLKATLLSVKIIPNVNPEMAASLGLRPDQRSVGLVTADSDDVTYTALDEATKKADVAVVYAKSFYAGAANANTKLAGEIIGIIAGPNPAEIRSGLNAISDFIENEAWFVSANEDNTIPYYAHCISRTGSYLSKVAGVPEGGAPARGHVRARRRAQGGGREVGGLLRSSLRDELRRRVADGLPVRVQGGLRRLCPGRYLRGGKPRPLLTEPSLRLG